MKGKGMERTHAFTSKGAKLVIALGVVASLGFLGACAPQAKPAEPAKAPHATEQTTPASEQHLMVYCGAGMKKAMEQVKTGFEAKNPGAKLDITYAGSGKLLAQLQSTHKGDLFIVGAKPDYENAKKEGLVQDNIPVANHTPAIVVKKGNPKHISSLKDLEKPDVKLVLADAASASIGRTANMIFEKNGINAKKNIKATVGTVTEIVTAVQSGNADAGICTKDSVSEAQDVEAITIPNDQNINQIITASITTFTKNQDLSNKFVAYLKSTEGKKAYSDHGFLPVDK